ncbi:MAG: hypothetical protein V2I67_17300 [Thermoanaerobaculales bacterium]|nr:hypothetical protein [Thermoanaerobaculales bacterium]
MRTAPSPLFGFLGAMDQWRIVVVVFVVSALVFVPARLVLWTMVGPALAGLPQGDHPDGEIILILIELVKPVWLPLALAFISGCVTLWAWTVLWHAGLVRWFHYSRKSGVRLAETLSRGLFGWWRWARLGLTSVVVLVLVQSAIAAVYITLEERAIEAFDDSMLGIYLETGILLGLMAAGVIWMATLRGAWVLGDSRRRSAIAAWFAGLWGTIRQPVRSLLTLVTWMAPALVAAIVPTFLGWWFESLRAMIPGTILGVVAGLLVAFCQVGLFLSFAPVSGLTDTANSKEP